MYASIEAAHFFKKEKQRIAKNLKNMVKYIYIGLTYIEIGENNMQGN